MCERHIDEPWDISVINDKAYTLVTVPVECLLLPSPLRILGTLELQQLGSAYGLRHMGQWTHYHVNKASPRTLALMFTVRNDVSVSDVSPPDSTIDVVRIATQTHSPITTPSAPPPSPIVVPAPIVVGPGRLPELTTALDGLSSPVRPYDPADCLSSRFSMVGL